VAVVGYSPFGNQGSLPSARTARGRVLQQIAEAHGATVHQIALRFLVRRSAVFTIPKASNPEHAAENARASELQLSDGELERIAEAFPLEHGRRGLPML
jgi:diketogulonate reductase-like aldo/keto reductase